MIKRFFSLSLMIILAATAWAVSSEVYDFKGLNSEKTITRGVSLGFTVNNGSDRAIYSFSITNVNMNLSRFGAFIGGETDGNFTLKTSGLLMKSRILSILNLHNGDKVTIEYKLASNEASLTLADPTLIGNVAENNTFESGTEYTISTTEDAVHLDIISSNNNNYIQKVTIKTTISGATVTLSPTSFTYNGEAQTPTVTSVVLNETTLTADDDYTIDETSQTNAGSYSTIVTGIGAYTGTATANWSIEKYDITNATAASDIVDQTHTGSQITPIAPAIKLGETTIDADNYDVTYGTNTEVGIGTVKYTAKTGSTNFTGTKTLNFNIVASDPTIYTVTVGNHSHGSLEVSPSEAAEGATITVTAEPDLGYQLSSITVLNGDANGSQYLNITDETRTFTMPANNVYVEAAYERKSYTITYNLDGGSVATENPTTYDIETATFTLNNPTKDNYTFAGWTGTGLDAASNTVTIAKGSTGNREYTATWTDSTPTSYLLTPTVSGSGEIHVVANSTTTKIDSATEYNAGTSIQLVAVPSDGYQLSSWSGDLAENDIPSSIWLNAKEMTSNISLTATFVAQPETVESISESRSWTFGSFTANTKLSGTKTYHYNGLYICGHNQNHQNLAGIETAGSNSVEFNDDGPTVNYQNYLWLAGGQDLSETNAKKEPNEFVRDYVAFKAAVPGTVYVYMGGKKDKYCRIYSGGTLKTTDTALTSDNSPGQYKASVAAGEVVRIGTNSGAAYIYAIAFVPASYTFKATSGSNGSITVMKGEDNVTENVAAEGGATYNYGTTFTLTATANNGYNFVNWTDGEESVVSTDNPYTISGLSANTTLKANFEAESHTHNFSYAVGTGENTNILTATCQNSTCSLSENKATLTLTATGGTYNGSPFGASTDLEAFNSSTGLSATVSINYTGDNSYNSADAPTNAGNYTATATVTIGEGTYNLTKDFTISKATLKATAADATRAVGEENPSFTVNVTDFVNDETAGTAAGYTAPTATCEATIESATGIYDITVSGGAATNYTFTYVNGTLTVNAPTTYDVSKATGNTDNISLDKSSATSGAIVTITVTIPDGKRIVDGKPVVCKTDDTSEIEVTKTSENVFTFIMPAYAVTVSAEFEDIPVEKSDPVVYDFTEGGYAQSSTSKSSVTYLYGTDGTNTTGFRYITQNNTQTRLSILNGKGNFSDNGLNMTDGNRPLIVDNLSKTDVIRIVYSASDGQSVINGNDPMTGSTLAGIEPRAAIESGKAIEITNIASDYAAFTLPTKNIVIAQLAINKGIKPRVVYDSYDEVNSKFVYSVGFYEGEVLHYQIGNETEQTVAYSDATDGTTSISVAAGNNLVCWTTYDEVESDKVTTKVALPQVPTATLKTDGTESKVYTIAFNEGETLHYTLPSSSTEYTVEYSAENEGTYDITVINNGNLIYWTTIGSLTSTRGTTEVSGFAVNLTAAVVYDFETAYANNNNQTLTFSESALAGVYDNDGKSGSTDQKRTDYFQLTNSSTELPFVANNYPISWRCPSTGGNRTYPTLVEGGIQASRPFAIHNLAVGDEIIVIVSNGNLTSYVATNTDAITVDGEDAPAGTSIASGKVIKVKSIDVDKNYIVLIPSSSSAVISAIYINKTPPVTPEQPSVSYKKNSEGKAVYTITSADENNIKYQLGDAAVVDAQAKTAEVTVDTKTTLKAWAYNSERESSKVEVTLLQTPIVETTSGVFDFTTLTTTNVGDANVKLEVGGDAVLTIGDTPLYKPTITTAATFAGKFAFQTPTSANTAVRNDKMFAINGAEGSSYYMAMLNMTAGKSLTITEKQDKAKVTIGEKSLTFGQPFEIESTDLDSNGNLILKFDVSGGSAQIQKIAITGAVQSYALNVNYDSTKGSVTDENDNELATSYQEGTKVNLKATATAEGYQFSGWYDGEDNFLSLKNPYEVPIKKATTIKAVFKQPTSPAPEITTEKVWTFDAFTAGTKLSGTKVYEYDGLYISGHNSETSSLATVTDGGTDTGTSFAGTVTQHLRIAGKNNSVSATAKVEDFTQDAIAFSAGVAGVVSAYVKGDASGRKYNVYIGGFKNEIDMTGDFQTLTKDIIQKSSVFISSSDGGHRIYAVKFTPEVVTDPSINDDGTITEGTSNLTDDANKVIKTYYTVDGTEPTAENGTLYEGVIMDSGEKTVKAVSINTVTGTKSEIVTKTLNLVLPTVTFGASVGSTGGGTVTWKIEGASDNTTATSFDKGTRIEVTAKPNSGYSFLNWTKDGVEVAKTTTYTFSLLENTTLVANFKDASSTVPVILTAGQSNTDGRVPVDDLPATFTGLENCYWSYCNAQQVYAGSAIKTPYTTVGNLEKYSAKNDNGGGWAYDAVVYHKIGEQLGQKFYVIKQSKGNTGISPASGGNGLFWSANPLWLSRNESANKGGRSLLKALIENIDASLTAIETESGKTADIKFLMWHQGEGDGNGSQGAVYYTQLKALINYVRNHLAAKNAKYSNLPIILGGITSVSAQYNADVEAAKQQLATEDANIYYVDINEVGTDGLLEDVLHFNATGAQTLGNKVWNTIYDNNLMAGLVEGTSSSEPVADILTEAAPVTNTTNWDFSDKAEGTAYAEKTNVDGMYLHGSSSNKMTVKATETSSVTYSDGETVTTSMALRSASGDRSKFMTNGLTAGDVVAVDRMIGVNTGTAGTFYAVIAPETQPTTEQSARELYLLFNGEKVATINALEAWNASDDHTIKLKYTASEAGTFFLTGQHPYLLYAAKFVKAGEETGGFTITTEADGGNISLTAPEGKTLESTFNKGEEVTLKATADEGYAFVKWTDGDDNELGTNATLTVTINSDTTIKAIFKGQTSTTVYDFAAVGSETLTYGEKSETSYYFWTESKAKDGSKNFCAVTNTSLASGNRIWIRVEDKDIADGKVNYALVSGGLSTTTTARQMVIDNLKVGDRVRIESSGTVQYVSSAEMGEATISDAVATQGATLAAKTTLTVTQGTYIVLLPAKGAVISKISINTDEAMKPSVSEPSENADGSKTYTVKINEGETLHYTTPDKSGEQTVAYGDTDNGSVQIKVTESGKLVCWTTLTANASEKSEEVSVTVSLSKDEPTEKITIHTIGDSTMSSYDQDVPAQKGMDGWGDYLIDCMKTEWVTVYNWADRGEGAKSYYNGIWLKTSTDRPEFAEPVMDKVKAGDYVIIQFGHNDSKAYSTEVYEEWMGKLVDAVSAKGAYPIIASSICRRRFENGEINKLGQINSIDDTSGRIPSTPVTGDTHEYDYPYHAKLVASAKNIPFIDVTAGTKALYESYGEEKSAAFFPSGEKTHTNELGARTIAKVVAQILYDDNTVLKKYVNVDALTLPDKESLTVETVIDNFKDEDVVTNRTIWTFNDKTVGSAIADATNTVVSQNGLYIRGYEGKSITAESADASPVQFSDGTKQSVKVVARTETLNTSGVNTFGSNTAGRSAASGLAPTFAVNIGTPGTFYAIMAPTTDDANRSLRLIFSGKEVINKPVSEAYAANHHWYEMKYHAETTGVIYLSAGVPTDLYAAMFIPDMEAGTEEDFNYQMVLTRSDGYWTYNNMSGDNQSVPEGLTVYAVTEINSDGKATLADYGKVIPTGAAVLVQGNPDTEYALPSTTEQATYSGTNLLVPNTKLQYLPATENDKTNYYFDGVKFIKATGYETIHEKQAYLSVSATADEILLDVPEPEVVPPYGEYDFRKFAVENVSGNTDKITVEKDANGVLTGKFTSTADNITINGSMTLNDAFSVTGSKASNVKLRKNGSTLTSTTSGLFINKSQATLNLLHLKEGNYFKIEYDGGLTFASTNVKKQGASSNVAEGDEVVSGASYMIESGSEVSLTFGKSDAASYIFTIIISEGPIVELVEGDLFISPNGNDNNAGTREAPLKTLKAAQEKAQSGNTIAILPGTYQVTNAEYMDKSSSTWNVVYNLDKKSISYIGEVGSDGKRPVFDFSGVTPEDGKRITGFLLKTSNIIIKNIETIGIQIPTSTSNVQSENFRLNGASDCLIKNVAAHHGKGVGFYIVGSSKNNTIEDCDAYENIDDINGINSKGQPAGENNDGFGCHVNENCPDNKFVRCRAWYNADDGFDFIRCYSVATIEDCIAYKNGYATYTNTVTGETKLAKSGNGNGFKAGGYGMSNDETGKAHPMHVVKGSIAVDQPHGFYANHHLGGLKFENNRAYKNNVDYLMTNRKGEGKSESDLVDVPGYNHEITGNISYGNTEIETIVGEIDTEICTLAGNSFSYSNGEWTNKSYEADDFVSLKVSDLLLDRDAEGNLPDAVFNFMKLKNAGEIIEDPTITLKSADESKTIYTVSYPTGTELHYKLPGSSKEQTATTSSTSEGKNVSDIEVKTVGTLQVWAVKNSSSSSVVKQSVLLLAPVVYDFVNTTSSIKADDGTKVRVMTYKDHNDKNQRDKDFWYVMDEDARLRVLIYNASGKYTQGTGLSLTKANRPVAIEGVKAGDFVRIFHNGGTLLDGNAESIGTTITDASSNAITGDIKSGQLIKVTATAGNPDDYVMFQSTTENFTITKVVINMAVEPTVEKDETKSSSNKWVYNISFLEDETLHYTSPDVNGEQTVTYTGSPVTIEVSNTGKLVCWTTVGQRTSETVTKTIDMVNKPAEVTISEGYQTYYAETALDFGEVSTDVMRAYIVKTTTTAAGTRTATRTPSASQLELVEVKKVPAKTALILWGKKAATVEIPQAEQTTVVITQVDGTEVNATVNLLKKAEKTESADANETIFVPNTDGSLSFDYSSFVTRDGIYIEIPTSVVGEDAKEITIGEPQEDGTIVPLETAVATIDNITPILDTENSSKSKKVYIFNFDSTKKLYYKRAGQDEEFRTSSAKDGGVSISNSHNGFMEYYIYDNDTKQSSRTDAKMIMLAPTATRNNVDVKELSTTYLIDFFDGATLYYTLGDDAEKTVDTGSPLELKVTKGTKITAYSKTSNETTESLSTNLYAPTPSIVNDSVYGFADIKNVIGIDYVLNSVGFEDEAIELEGISLKVPNALTSQTFDRFAFSAPRADGKGETSDWRLLNAGRLRAAKSEVDKHLLIQDVKKGNMLLLTYSGGPTISYVSDLSTAELDGNVTSITSNQKYEVTSDGYILLKIPADANNNCDITIISLSSQYNNSSSGKDSSSPSSPSDDKKTSSTAVTIGFYQLENDTTAIWRFEWEKGRELRYILEAEGTEQSGGTSGIYDLLVSKGDKVQAWTVLDSDTSKVVTANLLPPTRDMAIEGNYDFAENSEDLFADIPVALDMDRKVIVEGQTLYMPTALTYQTFKDRFAFSEFPKTSTLRIRKNRTLAFAKGEDVKMGILNLKKGDIVAFDFKGIIQMVNGDAVKKESASSRTRGVSQEMTSGASYVMQKDGDLLLNIMLSDSTVIINKMYVGEVPGRSASKAIDFVTAGEEFEALEFGTQSNVYIRDKEAARQFRWLTNDSRELPIDYKLSTESGEGAITTSGLTAGNRRVAIHNLGAGDKIKLRFSGGGVIFEGHETNGNIISVDGKQLVPGDSLRTGDVITIDKVNYLYNYVVLKLDSKASVSGIYINAEEVEKVWMPTIVDKGSNTIQITAGQSSLGNQVTTCYTTDGSEPTRINGTSGPYDEFDVQLLGGGLVTIKAISYTDGGVYSKVAELTIFADELLGGSGKSNTRGISGTYDMQGNKVETMQPGRLYIRDGKVVFFGLETK